MLKSKVNSIVVNNNNIYCALDEYANNILIISIKDYSNQTYLNGHEYGVTDLTFTKDYLISSDKEGNIVAWHNKKKIKKTNDFEDYIDNVLDIGNNQIAVLCFKKEAINFYDLFTYSNLLPIGSIDDIIGIGSKNNLLKLNDNILAVAGAFMYLIDLRYLQLINKINCAYSNDSISNFHFNNQGFFFVSQILAHTYNSECERGILGYYQYCFDDDKYPIKNKLIKLASKQKCHDNSIIAIRKIDSETIVTGSKDGKMKFWNLKKIN